MTDTEYYEKRKAVGSAAFPTMGYGDGMDLRDWFAGQALAGMLAHLPTLGPADIAADAYQWADAMLEARKTPPKAP